MNDILYQLDIAGWKSVAAALLLPPVPFLLLGVLLLCFGRRRRAAGLGALMLAGIWCTSTLALGDALARSLAQPLQVLAASDIARLKQQHRAGRPMAIVVLGGGAHTNSAEYGQPSLNARSLARLRYGMWLSRATGIAVAFTGGASYLDANAPREADVAARIATEEFGLPLRWVENRARDTRENALFTVDLLRRAGVREVVLVTHDWHMRRSLRAFGEAFGAAGMPVPLTPAMTEQSRPENTTWRAYLPSGMGLTKVRDTLREWLALIAGA